MPCIAQVATVAPMIVPPRPALARGRVRHVGDPVAFVVAETREGARDAAERSRSTTARSRGRRCPAALSAGRAADLGRGARQSLPIRFERGDKAAVEAAFAGAAHVVEIELVNNRLVVAPIEPRAAIGSYDAGDRCLDLLLTGQGVHGIRRQLADAVFHVPLEQIVVHAPDVGGGFGIKNFLYPEWVLVLWAARRSAGPVAGSPSAARSSSAPRRAATTPRRRGSRSTRRAVPRARRRRPSPISAPISRPTARAARPTRRPRAMGGVYEIPAIFMDVRGVFTNTVPIDAYRGAGKPEANYLIERLVEVAARRLGSTRPSCAGAT